jgi:prophage tail gpP-like protein
MRPTPGQTYTVRPGDTLRNVARAAYGNDQGARIAKANERELQGRPISAEGLPVLRPGDVLEIPDTDRYDGRTITADFDSEMSVKINGTTFRGVKTTSVTRAVNAIADGFIFEAPVDYRNRAHVDAFRPFGYQTATLYIGGEPYITGQLLKPSFEAAEDSIIVTAEARSKPGDMVECMGQTTSLERSNITLLAVAEEIAGRYNLRAFSASGSSGGTFEQVTKEVTETDFAFLSRLAAQKGYLVTTSHDGNLLLTRAAVDETPVAALRWGSYPVKSVSASYDGTRRFSTWFGYAETTEDAPITASLRDPGVNARRPFAFSADEADAGSIEDAVRWRMAKSVADATTIDVQIAGYRNEQQGGDLWQENRKVTLWAPPAFIFRETEMIIQSVRLTKDESGGDTTALSLVFPEAYNLENRTAYPWDGYNTGRDSM